MKHMNEGWGIYPHRFGSYYCDHEDVWFTAFYYNALFKLDKESSKVEYMGSFPNENPYGIRLYSYVVKQCGKLYFVPLNAKEIAVYDLNTGQFEKIDFDKNRSKNGIDIVENNPGFKFSMAVVYSRYIFFIGMCYPAIVRYDTETRNIDYFTDWVNPLKQRGCSGELYFIGGALDGNKLYLAACETNAVVAFDMNTFKSSVYEIGSKDSKYRGICFDGKHCWLTPRFGVPIVIWDPLTNDYKEYGGVPVDSLLENDYYICFYLSGYVCMFRTDGNLVLMINVMEEHIERMDKFHRLDSWCFPTAKESALYAINLDNCLLKYDIRTKQLHEWPIRLTEETLCEVNARLFDIDIEACRTAHNSIFSEGRTVLWNLHEFLRYITHGPDRMTAIRSSKELPPKNDLVNTAETAGQKIYSYLKNSLTD